MIKTRLIKSTSIENEEIIMAMTMTKTIITKIIIIIMMTMRIKCKWRTVCITVWHHLTIVTVGQGMLALLVDYSEQLHDCISTCDVSKGCYMLLLFLFVLLLFVFCCCCFFYCFFTYSNMISIGTVEFRYYVVIIILVNLRKP